MKLFTRPIFTGFMPNLLGKEVLLALSFIFPWNFKNLQSGKAVSTLENTSKHFSVSILLSPLIVAVAASKLPSKAWNCIKMMKYSSKPIRAVSSQMRSPGLGHSQYMWISTKTSTWIHMIWRKKSLLVQKFSSFNIHLEFPRILTRL